MTPTPRELEVLRAYVYHRGSRKETGRALGLSPNTINAHIRSAYEKIGVNCLLDAAEWLQHSAAAL